MECKNCGSSLRSDFSFCPSCGAKIIRNRLSIKNVWQDISFQLFNLDNTFLKTFRHMFLCPHEVVESYISGIRKKYMNPISYYAISIAVMGIVFFILTDVYGVNLIENSLSETELNNFEYVFDYQGILSYLIVPLYSLITWLLFIDINKFNYTEHLVANTFISAQLLFVQILISLPLFGLSTIPYDIFTWIFLLLSVVYQFYILKRIHGTGVLSTMIRGVLYLAMFAVLMLGFGVLIVMISLLTGKLSPEDIKAFN